MKSKKPPQPQGKVLNAFALDITPEATVLPKGDKIVSTLDRGGGLELHTMNLDGSDV